VDTLQTEKKPESVYDIDIMGIMRKIPHRYPFLLIDHVNECNCIDLATGYKNVSINEPFFQGHFPNKPVMPGVLIVEALAQMGCFLVAMLPEGQGKLVLFSGINDVRFRRQVLPGDRLDLEARLLKLKMFVGRAGIKATVNGELVCEGEIVFSLVDAPPSL
jgi:3-hydroxyacyl-[acyl-carrier-protein] dehydratase